VVLHDIDDDYDDDDDDADKLMMSDVHSLR